MRRCDGATWSDWSTTCAATRCCTPRTSRLAAAHDMVPGRGLGLEPRGVSLLVSASWALVGRPADGRIERDVGLLVQDGVIADIGPSDELRQRYPHVPEARGAGLLALPG